MPSHHPNPLAMILGKHHCRVIGIRPSKSGLHAPIRFIAALYATTGLSRITGCKPLLACVSISPFRLFGVVDRGGAGFSRLDSGISPSCYVSFPTGFTTH